MSFGPPKSVPGWRFSWACDRLAYVCGAQQTARTIGRVPTGFLCNQHPGPALAQDPGLVPQVHGCQTFAATTMYKTTIYKTKHLTPTCPPAHCWMPQPHIVHAPTDVLVRRRVCTRIPWSSVGANGPRSRPCNLGVNVYGLHRYRGEREPPSCFSILPITNLSTMYREWAVP